MSTASAPWEPTTIKKVVDAARETASQVVVVETNQGSGYLKAMGNRAGIHSLAVEVVATRLAQWLGLPTLTFAVIDVTNVPPIELDPGRLAQPGPAFITRAENGISWGNDPDALDALDNPDDLALMVAFDTWVRNCDRHMLRAGRDAHMNRDNVFLSTEGASEGRFVMKPIDHAQCFCFATVLTPALLRSETAIRDDRLYGYFPEFESRMDDVDARQSFRRIAAIRREEVENTFTDLPPAWGISDDIRDAWCDLVCGRATFLSENVDRSCASL
jgi:hypothetical protein